MVSFKANDSNPIRKIQVKIKYGFLKVELICSVKIYFKKKRYTVTKKFENSNSKVESRQEES